MSGRYRCPVVEVEKIAEDVRRISFRSALIAGTALPGQFAHVMVGLPEDGGFMLRRPISIHCIEGDLVHMLIRAVGRGTRWLCDRKVGDELDVMAPLGRGFSLDGPGRPIVVAGGIGCGPLLFVLQRLHESGRRAAFIIGARNSRELYSLERFSDLAEETIITTDDGSRGRRGLVTDVLIDQLRGGRDAHILACGPVPMLREVSRVCAEAGIPAQVSLEALMACGIGACQVCVHKARSADSTSETYVRVCSEGPVFPSERVIW